MRFSADRREVGDGDPRPAHSLGRERDGVERGRHVDLAAGGGRRFDTHRDRDGHRGDDGDDGDRPSAHNENESYHTGA